MNSMSKSPITFADITNELQRSYDFFVDYYKLDKEKFANALITVQAAGRRQALGWLGKDFWTNEEEQKRAEINISAEHLNREVIDILGTLIHEMAHMKNTIAGIKDCNPLNQYHNKNFKVAAESFGLIVDRLEGKGFALTTLGDVAKDAIEKLKPNEEVYNLFRVTRKSLISSANKYIAVFISSTYKEKLEDACKKTGLKKKELVEQLLDDNF